jgi:hypothetical protein
LHNPNASEDNWEADNESDIDLDNGSEDSETPEQRNVTAASNVCTQIPPIQQFQKKVEKWLMIVNIMDTRRNTAITKMLAILPQCIITKIIMLFDQEIH